MSGFTRVPGNCGVRLDAAGLNIELWGTRPHAQPSLWTALPLVLEDDEAPTRVLGARVLEWLIDLLVVREREGHMQLEVWRASPYRILRRWQVGPRVTADPASLEVCSISSRGFRLRDKTNLFLISQRDFHSAYSAYKVPWHDYDVFISFKDKDAHARAKRLCSELESRDLRVWFSPDRIETNYEAAITAGIDSSASYAIIWSESSDVQSGISTGSTAAWSQSREHEVILEKGRRRFYCVLGDAKVPEEHLADRYQQIKLDVVGEAAFAEMILSSFKMKAVG